jgi:hypothetical protein
LSHRRIANNPQLKLTQKERGVRKLVGYSSPASPRPPSHSLTPSLKAQCPFLALTEKEKEEVEGVKKEKGKEEKEEERGKEKEGGGGGGVVDGASLRRQSSRGGYAPKRESASNAHPGQYQISHTKKTHNTRPSRVLDQRSPSRPAWQGVY